MPVEEEILEADLADGDHQGAILGLLNAYARDPMGDGQDLSEYAKRHLIAGLAAHPTTLVFIAYRREQPVGLAICFRGFSTFAAKPLINIHDFVVLPACRGQGIGKSLLAAVEAKARELGCCKLTLEVQEKNVTAQRVYHGFGFNQAQYVREAGLSLFFAKPLS
jgi:GNAT superfamily N-acetyltransferase